MELWLVASLQINEITQLFGLFQFFYMRNQKPSFANKIFPSILALDLELPPVFRFG